MKITARLQKFLIDECEAKSTFTEEEFRKAAADALVSGELTPEKMAELTKSKDDEEADGFLNMLQGTFKEIGDTLTELKAAIHSEKEETPELKKTEPEKEEMEDDKEMGKCKECGKPVMLDEKGGYKCKACGYEHTNKSATPGGTKGGERTMSSLEKLFSGTFVGSDDGEKDFQIRVKEAIDQYDGAKTALTYPEYTKSGHAHPLAGQKASIKDFSMSGSSRTLDSPSQKDEAIIGAYAKYLCHARRPGMSKRAAFEQLPQHDRELIFHALENEKWSGRVFNENSDYADVVSRKLTPNEQKALIDDAASGGLEAAPIVFDDRIIETPLLYGELFPLVNRIPLDRGRRVEGVATGTVTGSWGGVDDSAISLFNTASYVSAFDTTIYRWEGAVRIGLDFLSDTPIDFGAHFTRQYGERLLEDLDDVIAAGNGTTQPEGVINKSGTTSVSFGGSTTIGGYESLRFGVSKSEHSATMKNTAVFCGTETSYQRVMALPVGAADNRRLFGAGQIGGTNSYDGYSIMQRKYAINESLSNQQIFYAILGRYRMYVRRGLTVDSTREGDTLKRNNEMLLICSARYGGQLERGGCASKTTNAPS